VKGHDPEKNPKVILKNGKNLQEHDSMEKVTQ